MTINRWPRIFPLSGKNQGGGKDTLWLHLTVQELKSQNMEVRKSGGLVLGSAIDRMQFLLPMTFSETINHRWEDTDTLASKIAEKYRAVTIGAEQLANIAKSSYSSNASLITSSVDTNIRPDSPTLFKSSEKRQLPLSFNLADQGDTEKDIFEPVNLLMYYSSSGMADDFFKIDYPYIFRLQTIDGNNKPIPLISFQHAALVSVQPIYFGPYRNGYPTRCELTLQFQDLEPLFKKTFRENSSPRVTASVRSK